MNDLELPETSDLMELRRSQDERFFKHTAYAASVSE
jgi:hypothetical protein